MNLPDCTCGRNDWQDGGSHLGPGYDFRNRKCRRCGNHGATVDRDGLLVMLVYPPGLEKTANDYINGPLVVLGRVRAVQLEAVTTLRRDLAGKNLLTEWGLEGNFPKRHFLPDAPRGPDGLMKFEWRSDENPGPIPGLNHEAFDAAVCKMYDRLRDVFPHALLPPSDPILVPEGVEVHVWRGAEHWDKVIPTGSTRQIILPEDPLRREHEKFFREVFSSVDGAVEGSESPYGPIRPERIPNRYHDDHLKAEPWFTFTVNDATFTVGPRKRVVAISVTHGKPTNVTELRDLALKDGVTYEADGAWQNPTDTATTVMVHAWGKDKTIEYLTVAVRGCLE